MRGETGSYSNSQWTGAQESVTQTLLPHFSLASGSRGVRGLSVGQIGWKLNGLLVEEWLLGSGILASIPLCCGLL